MHDVIIILYVIESLVS